MSRKKKSLLKIFSVLFLGSLAFSSCDKIRHPYVPVSAGNALPGVRKILIEDFTGQKCGNCPMAARTIETIKGLYPGKVISIGVHCDYYAIPSAAPYDYDFRTAPGNDYNAFFGPVGTIGQPTGLVNRKDYPGNEWKTPSSWGGAVDSLLNLPPDADIKITNTYNSSSRALNISVRVGFLKSLSGTYKLMAVLTEDSIVKPQKDYSMPAGQQDVLNYVHRHVLRDAISSTSWGDILVSGNVVPGDTVLRTFAYVLPAGFAGLAPDENRCSIVAYVYNAATYQVVQAEEKKIK